MSASPVHAARSRHEIARTLGISPPRVLEIERQALRKLRWPTPRVRPRGHYQGGRTT